MGGGARPDRESTVSPVDRLGRRISPVVLHAAEQIGRRAIQHAEKLLIDPAVAASLLEEAAATVSRALDAKRHRTENVVRDLPSYLFLAFIRRVNKTKKRQLLLEDAARVRSAVAHDLTDPRAELELKILVDELLTRCDSVTRDMFYRRVQGFSWKEIGLSYVISGHAAESRFNQALHKIGVRLGLRSD
jgi:hypothetical protein